MDMGPGGSGRPVLLPEINHGPPASSKATRRKRALRSFVPAGYTERCPAPRRGASKVFRSDGHALSWKE